MAKTDTARRRATIAIFAYHGCSSWITAGLIELFAIANVAIAQGRGKPRLVCFDCGFVGRSQRAVAGSHGVRFTVEPHRRRYDAIIVPPLWCESREDLERRWSKLKHEITALRELSRRSPIMASACSGSVLLADAGLLANRRATTCWWLVEWFRRHFPDTELAPHELVMIDRGRWTAAAGSAYIHLGLELVRKFAGEEVAALTARLMLVERRRGSQSPFMTAESATRAGSDPDVERTIRYLDEHAATSVTIANACRTLALNERTLTRKFQAILGMPPLAYLQSQRVARARELLEGSGLSLERIVERCGYQDISSFRKLFRRHVGMTPREYRSRFGVAAASTGEQERR